MPENPSPAAKPEPNSEPIEFNFEKAGSDSPRIKRRSLKTKAPGLQAATPALAAAPTNVQLAAKPSQPAPVITQAPAKATTMAPPKSIPTVSSTPVTPAAEPKDAVVVATKPATPSSNGVTPFASGQKVNIALTSTQKTTAAVLAASDAKGPHGTRPATLYYTSQPKKEATSSMKPTTTASSASSATRPATAATSTTTSAARPASAASAATSAARTTPAASASAARPVTASVTPTSATRPAGGGFDYRANVERQSREQKSVGSILSYFVYGLIAVFVIGASLATYGTVIIFDRLHDHATSISSLDDKYAQKDAELTKAIVTMQDSLSQSNATIAQQRDLLNKQEEEINQLHAAINSASSATADAIHAEARARANEAAALKARIRDLENRTSSQNGTMSIRP
jgi:uncharacterized coiled-coil protein SlyX